MTSIPKCLHYAGSSGNTCIHHMCIDLFPQSIVAWAYIRQTEVIKAMLALMKVDCFFRGATTFPAHISVYTGLYLDVSLCWSIHCKFILWNSFDLRYESVTYRIVSVPWCWYFRFLSTTMHDALSLLKLLKLLK